MKLRTKIMLLAALPLLLVAGLASPGLLGWDIGSLALLTGLLAVIALLAWRLGAEQGRLLALARRLAGDAPVPDGRGRGRGTEATQLGRDLHRIARRLEHADTRICALEAALEEAHLSAERATAAKRAFMATVGHEIRTPMNAIIGMTRLSLTTELSTKQRDYLERADRAAQALLSQINDILDYVRIEAGELRMKQVAFRLDEVLDDVVGIVRQKAGEKALTVRLDRDPAIPPMLLGDPQRLSQVLSNLADNAVKFTERGEVAITCRLIDVFKGHAEVGIEVCDTGIGIAADQRDALFDAFTQADGSIARRYGGSGLGLSICYRLVAAMRGRLQVDSEPGRGSRFSFTIAFPLGIGAGTDMDGTAATVYREDLIPDRRRLPQSAPALDLAGTRIRVQGDEALLGRLLRRFQRDHASFVADYRLLYGTGDRFGAAQLARELESAAASLGATDLREAAARLALKRRLDDDPAPDLRIVGRLVEDLCAEIARQIASAGYEPASPRANPAPTAPAAELEPALRRLADLLAGFDAAAINSFERLRPQLAGLGQGRILDGLQRDLNGFDFVPALAKLRELADDAGIRLTEPS